VQYYDAVCLVDREQRNLILLFDRIAISEESSIYASINVQNAFVFSLRNGKLYRAQ